MIDMIFIIIIFYYILLRKVSDDKSVAVTNRSFRSLLSHTSIILKHTSITNTFKIKIREKCNSTTQTIKRTFP